MNGKGEYYWTNGNSYKGDYKKDDREGFGVFTWTGGRKYEGQWQQNR